MARQRTRHTFVAYLHAVVRWFVRRGRHSSERTQDRTGV